MVMEKYVESYCILEALEKFAAAFPWDEVDIWIGRKPEGALRYTAYLRENDQFGFNSAFGRGDSAAQAVQDVIKQVGDSRDPEKSKEKKINALKQKVAELEQLVIGTPPYVPNRELAERNPVVDIG